MGTQTDECQSMLASLSTSVGTQTDECQSTLVGQMVIAYCPDPSIVLDYIASNKPPAPQILITADT